MSNCRVREILDEYSLSKALIHRYGLDSSSVLVFVAAGKLERRVSLSNGLRDRRGAWDPGETQHMNDL